MTREDQEFVLTFHFFLNIRLTWLLKSFVYFINANNTRIYITGQHIFACRQIKWRLWQQGPKYITIDRSLLHGHLARRVSFGQLSYKRMLLSRSTKSSHPKSAQAHDPRVTTFRWKSCSREAIGLMETTCHLFKSWEIIPSLVIQVLAHHLQNLSQGNLHTKCSSEI